MPRRKKNVAWAPLGIDAAQERFDYYLRDGEEDVERAFKWIDIHPKREGLNGYIEGYSALRTASALWEVMPPDQKRLERMQNFEDRLDSLEGQLVKIGLLTKR